MKKITNKELIDVFRDFDKELELDEEKLAELSDKQKSELYLAIKKVLTYREDFPPDLADAVQQLAKQSVEKQQIQKGNQSDSASDLSPDPEDAIVLDDGSIIEKGDELFPLAKKLDNMDAKEVEQFVDDLARVVLHCCQVTMVKLLDKQVRIIEKQRGIKLNKQNDDKRNWPTVVNQT